MKISNKSASFGDLGGGTRPNPNPLKKALRDFNQWQGRVEDQVKRALNGPPRTDSPPRRNGYEQYRQFLRDRDAFLDSVWNTWQRFTGG